MKREKLNDYKRAQAWSVEVKQEQANANIFPVAPTDLVFLENAKGMVCVDHDQMKELKISGRSSSPTGRSLMIEFYPCLGGKANDCHEESDVMEDFRHANLVVLNN